LLLSAGVIESQRLIFKFN